MMAIDDALASALYRLSANSNNTMTIGSNDPEPARTFYYDYCPCLSTASWAYSRRTTLSDEEIRRRYWEYVAAHCVTRHVKTRRPHDEPARLTHASPRTASQRMTRRMALSTTRAHRRAVRQLLA